MSLGKFSLSTCLQLLEVILTSPLLQTELYEYTWIHKLVSFLSSDNLHEQLTVNHVWVVVSSFPNDIFVTWDFQIRLKELLFLVTSSTLGDLFSGS